MGPKKGTNGSHKRGKSVRTRGIILCTACRKPMRQGIVWVRTGVVVRTRQAYHKECV